MKPSSFFYLYILLEPICIINTELRDKTDTGYINVLYRFIIKSHIRI